MARYNAPSYLHPHHIPFELQQFIADHRDVIRDEDSDRPLTFHGLRHTYAVEKYKALLAAGKTELDAHYEVSRLLGHERPDVTDIYLASLDESEKVIM